MNVKFYIPLLNTLQTPLYNSHFYSKFWAGRHVWVGTQDYDCCRVRDTFREEDEIIGR